MAKKKDEKDVLVVRDEKTGEISVVAGLNAVSYTHLHESSREKLEGAIHSPHEETYLCPRQTVNKTGRPTDQLHRI